MAQQRLSPALKAVSDAVLAVASQRSVDEVLQRLQQLAREALDELRSLIYGLRPPELERDGLEGALRKQVAMLERLHDVEIELHLDGSATSGPDRDGEVLRIAQEAIHNAVRHAGATRIVVRLERDDRVLSIEVDDDGVGFDPDDPELRARHLGLTSIEERAEELGGTVTIRSAPGRGTTVRLEVSRDA